MWRGEVIQQMRLQILRHWRDSDIDHSPGLFEGFFKRYLAEIQAQELLQLAIVHDRLLAEHLAQRKPAP